MIQIKQIFLCFGLSSLLLLLLSCEQQVPKKANKSSSSKSDTKSLTSGEEDDESSSSSSDDEDEESAEARERSAPNFDSSPLDGSFNRNKYYASAYKKPAQDADKIFLIQNIDAYRPIWLNLDHNVDWGGDDAGRDGEYRWQIGTQGTKDKQLSIHQPLSSIAGSDNLSASMERGDDFKVIGHAISPNLQFPETPTAVLSLYAISYQSPEGAALRAPMAYQQVYDKLGPLTEDLFAACQRLGEAAQNQEAPDLADQERCNMVTAGGSNIWDYLNVQMQGSTMTGVGSLEDFYQKQSLVIWKPIPPPGYQCLGQMISNTPDQPSTSGDAGGYYAQVRQTLVQDQFGNYMEQSSLDYPMYCVQEKYLVEAKLQFYAGNGGVDLFKVVPKDEQGIGNTNLFWAFPQELSSEERSKVKVYTLNKDYVKVLPPILTGTPKTPTP